MVKYTQHKWTILTIFKCTIVGIDYIHIAVEPSPQSISRAFSSSKWNSVSIKHSPHCPSSHSKHKHTLCFYEFD